MVSDPEVFIDNPVFDLAEEFIHRTSRSIFLTGKAGTGKTTFLRKIRASCPKNSVVVAPTGVAAINAGGTTIHSFFQLPFAPFVPAHGGGKSLGDTYTLLQNLRIDAEKRNMFRELQLLIIDEVSMVRCDVLDSIDIVLRYFRKREHLPFGGVQVLFIGDLFQLPPVAQGHEWSILSAHYESPFFFDSHVIRESPPVYIELKQIFRQKDDQFIGILNRIRMGETTKEDLEMLNVRHKPEFTPPDNEKYIVLTTHNARADRINIDEINKLPQHEQFFEAVVEGDFPERSYPTEKMLMLKIGAQVMFVKNDLDRMKRYFNGKIGTITRIEEGRIFVAFPGEEGEIEVERDTWRNMRYAYDSRTRSIDEEVIGIFTQYPLRLAWAITIHKSQGLTFERAIIDAGSSFASGQVYVALSRCTSLDGLVLKSRIFRQSIITDERVLDFASEEISETRLKPLLEYESQQHLAETLIQIFDFSSSLETLDQFAGIIPDTKRIEPGPANDLAESCRAALMRLQEVAMKFGNQLRALSASQDYDAVRQRVAQGVAYFDGELLDSVLKPIDAYKEKISSVRQIRRFKKRLGEWKTLVESQRQMLHKAVGLAENLGRISPAQA